MNKTLVVYYSRTGYTRKIAEAIASACDADIEGLEDVKSRSGIFGYLRSAREALTKSLADIKPLNKEPAPYDLLILGTPVWAGHVSSPIRSYIEQHKNLFKQVAFFCTQGGSGAEKVLQNLVELCGKEPVATLALKDADIHKQNYDDSLNQFLNLLPISSGQVKKAV